MFKNKFILRKATLKDLDILAYQRKMMFVDMGSFSEKEAARGNNKFKKWLKERLKDKTAIGFLIESGGKAVSGGCVWLKPCQPNPSGKKPEIPYLFSVYTNREYRGKGLASRIVKEASKWAAKRGYAFVELHASKQGESVYKKLGFKRTKEMRLMIRKK